MGAKTVLNLSEVKDISLAGGKGYSLAKLINAGFKVPDGFVVTTLSDSVMSPELESDILNYFDNLGAKFVAVRSSAVAEDGKNDAWAGQLDTFLNVSRDQLIDSVKKCWESANSKRAKSYAKQKKLAHTKVAVVVQAMVQGEVSGIAFSANPVTKDSSQMVIEAGYGLNEPIVSGEITPDTYIIDKDSGNILDKSVSNQTKKLVQGAGGQNEWQETGSESDKQKLTDENIKKLVDEVIKLEDYFGLPIDSEWTLAEGKFYILQARPITTL